MLYAALPYTSSGSHPPEFGYAERATRFRPVHFRLETFMRKITVYTRQLCGFCTRATRVLEEAGYAFEAIAADGNPALRAELIKRSGQSTLPQIFVGEESVGGYQELAIALSDGRFAQLLEGD